MKYIINCTSEWRESKKIIEKYPIIKNTIMKLIVLICAKNKIDYWLELMI